MADDVAGGVARDGGLGVGGLQDFGGVIVEDGTKEIGEGGEGFAHFGEMRAELWAFQNDDSVDMFNGEVFFVEKFARVLQEEKAICALPLGIGIGKMRADVSQTRRAQQRVAECVGHYVAVGMSHGALVERDFDAADDEL